MFRRDSTFKKQVVTHLHMKTTAGIKFNVQDISTQEKQPALLQVANEDETKHTLLNYAKQFYTHSEEFLYPSTNQTSYKNSLNCPPLRIESISTEENTIISPNENNFTSNRTTSLTHILLYAFANHYPITLKPDDIWMPIVYAASLHIQENAEELRKKFVSFNGKKLLEYKTYNRIGTFSKSQWEGQVFEWFSNEIRENIGSEMHDLLTSRFTTTTKTDHAANQISLMAGMSKYFNYQILTLCGIPWIELQGSLDDWKDIRKRVEQIKDIILPSLGNRWIPFLLPILDEFIAAYKGEVNHEFWQRMVKVTYNGHSGQSEFVSGWINNFYPFLTNFRPNESIQPWEKMTTFQGPEIADFPSLISSVEVKWNDLDTEYPLHFHGGLIGMAQDKNTLALRAHNGWIVTHDPPMK